MTVRAAEILRTVVPDDRRLAFMPAHWGRGFLMIKIESRIYAYAEKALPGYRGGYWDFVQCSNGAGYLRTGDPAAIIHWQGIGEFCTADVAITMDGACLALTAVALNHELSHLPENDTRDSLIREWDLLMEVTRQHPDADALYAILD